MSQQQKPRRVKARTLPDGWSIEMDHQTWAEIMTAISIAIDTCERGDDLDRAKNLRALRNTLIRVEG